MTIREDILAAITTRFGATAKRAPEVGSTAPIIGIYDDLDTVESIEFKSVNCVMPVRVERIEKWTTAQGGRSQRSNVLLGEIIATMTGTDRTLGGICSDIKYSQGGALYTPEETGEVSAFAVFDVFYKFDVGDPDTDSFDV